MLIIENINIRNEKKNAKSIATYDFSTLYTTLPLYVIDFVFKGGNKTHLHFQNNVAYWGKNVPRQHSF